MMRSFSCQRWPQCRKMSAVWNLFTQLALDFFENLKASVAGADA
jgi:hypothetical protein